MLFQAALSILFFILISTGAHASDCASLLAAVQSPLDKVKVDLMTADGDVEKAIDMIKKTDLRHKVFRLEAISRVFRKKNSSAKKALDIVKRLEDAIGAYMFQVEILEAHSNAQLNPKLEAYIQMHLLEQRALLADVLKNDGWMKFKGKKSAYRRVKKYFNDPTLPHEPEDFANEVSKFLIGYLSDLQTDLEDNKYDPSEIELGIHELRRDIRWLPIYLQSQSDLFEIDKEWSLIPDYHYLIDEMKDNKYAQLPDKSFTGAIRIPASLFYAFVRYTKVLGDAKDLGLLEEAILHYSNETKVKIDRQKLRTYLHTEFGEQSPQATAEQVVSEVLETELFKVFRSALQQQ